MEKNLRYGVMPSTISFQIREPGAAITHFIGLLGIMVGYGPLVMRARSYGSFWSVIGVCVFLITSGLLYAASSLYHTVVLSKEKTKIFKKIDHMMISVMIAGSYTAVCVTVLRGHIGWILLTVIWTMALGGILLKALWVTCPKWISSCLYLAMGWACVFALVPLFHLLPHAAFMWLTAGGVMYSVGALIYALKCKGFNERHIYFGTHEIFHCFIMAGTLCHYIFMYSTVAVWR